MPSLSTFEDLESYSACRAFRSAFNLWARDLPESEKFLLRAQIVDAARSITANIAEGFGRHHPQENLQFCRIARGSLMECLDHLNTAIDEGLMSAEDQKRLRDLWHAARRPLQGYITYLESIAKKDRRFHPAP